LHWGWAGDCDGGGEYELRLGPSDQIVIAAGGTESLKIKIDHESGQYRAELFELLIYHLLKVVYSEMIVAHGLVLPKGAEGGMPSLALDFAIVDKGRIAGIGEAKAPYTDAASFGINKTFRRMKEAFNRFPQELRPKEIIIAMASELPATSAGVAQTTKEFFERSGAELKIWDAKKLSKLLEKHLNLTIHSFSIENLEKALRSIDPEAVAGAQHTDVEGGALVAPSQKDAPSAGASVKSGEYEGVVVLCADFCSYTKFVLASGADQGLISSVMGRFYRETRRIIEDGGGIVDKYMGDGILAFWMPSAVSDSDLGKKIESCGSQLIACALGIAKEWQDQIDHSVDIVGMRVGVAIGKVLFISEIPGREQPMHAISDYINLAARLQTAAKENSLVISNRLRKACFDGDSTFEELDPLELKNFGKVIAWSKDYEKG
jgi:class 3 adenylate cyclase